MSRVKTIIRGSKFFDEAQGILLHFNIYLAKILDIPVSSYKKEKVAQLASVYQKGCYQFFL
jgi:hypothetical protein